MRDAFANQRLEDTKEPVWLDERQHSKYVTASRDPGRQGAQSDWALRWMHRSAAGTRCDAVEQWTASSCDATGSVSRLQCDRLIKRPLLHASHARTAMASTRARGLS
jgi:hypothetical protein